MNKQKRAPNRKMVRGLSLLWKAVCAVLACLAVVLAVTVFFKTDVVGVTGATHTPANEIIEVSGIKTGENLFLIRDRAVEKSITERFPYVEKTKIRRKLPGTLIIAVTEAEPEAQIQFEDGYWIISASGKLLEFAAQRSEGVIEVFGCELSTPREGDQMASADSAAPSTLLRLLEALRDGGAAELTDSVDVGKSYSLSLRYDERFTVELGTLENLDYKVEYFLKIVGELDPNAVGRIDVSRGAQADFIPE